MAIKGFFIFMRKKKIRKTPNNRGATIVESMLAIALLLIVVIGGAAFIYHNAGAIAIEKNKRIALEVANRRLEEMRASNYEDIIPMPADDWNVHNIKLVSGSWVLDSADDENVVINGINFPITTIVQYVDGNADTPPDSHDYILANVRVGYRLNPDERVELVTIFGPWR
jgi:type II secretory pathway pseudopilin PulG